MIGIYLSGTGNTKHCVEKLVNLLDAAAECIPLEAPHVTETLEMQSTIILGYPTQFSNAPFGSFTFSITTFLREREPSSPAPAVQSWCRS